MRVRRRLSAGAEAQSGMMWAISALGDTALLAPAAGALVLYLAACRRTRAALAFGFALALTGIATLAGKLLFRACGPGLDLDIVSPSGHASFATLFYGSLALLLAAKSPFAFRLVLAGGTVLLLAAIGVSRVAIDVHSPEEVALGFAIGLVGLVLFAALKGPQPAPPLWPLVVAGGCAAAIVVLGGLHFNLEGRIVRAAARLAALDLCPPASRGGLVRMFSAEDGLRPASRAARLRPVGGEGSGM